MPSRCSSKICLLKCALLKVNKAIWTKESHIESALYLNFSALSSISIINPACGRRIWLQWPTLISKRTQIVPSFSQINTNKRKSMKWCSNCPTKTDFKQSFVSKNWPQNWLNTPTDLYLSYLKDPSLCENSSLLCQTLRVRTMQKNCLRIDLFCVLARLKLRMSKSNCHPFFALSKLKIIKYKIWRNILLKTKLKRFSSKRQNSSLHKSYPENLEKSYFRAYNTNKPN